MGELTKLGNHEKWYESQMLTAYKPLGGSVKYEQILMVSAPDLSKKMFGYCQQGHELHKGSMIANLCLRILAGEKRPFLCL